MREFLKAYVVEKGLKGWMRMEIFDRRVCDASYKIDEATRRARPSWAKLLRDVESPQLLPPEATTSSQHVDFSFSQFHPEPEFPETRSTPNQTDFDAWFNVSSLAFPGISYQPIPPNENPTSTQQFDLPFPRWPSEPQPLHIWSLPSESDWDDWFAEPLLTFPVPFIEPVPQLPLDSIASSLNGTQVAISDESLGNFSEPLSAIGQEQLAATRTSDRSRKKMKQQKGTYPDEGSKCLMGCIDKTFATERDLSRHYYKTGIHPTINQHGCFICRCGKKSLRKDNHVRHVRTCKLLRGSGYSCAKCGDTTPDKQGHLDHLAGCVDTRGRKPRERGR
ncbi:putative Xylose isomerase-like TIM barrel domain-containing protein [Seiridium cardinale]